MDSIKRIGFFLFLFVTCLQAQTKILIPMDDLQNDHLKAYGVTYAALSAGLQCSWLLNYRGGSFVIEDASAIEALCAKKGVSVKTMAPSQYMQIKLNLQTENMAEIKLEKTPKIAVYTPPNMNPWADSVTLVLEYAEIPYDKLYDKEILKDDLKQYDWLHLHHEDFSGQFSKFWISHHRHAWFKAKVATVKQAALEAGYRTVREHKLAVAKVIQLNVSSGLFLFAMCAATETLDVALAADGVDIVDPLIDGSPIDPQWQKKIDYNKTFAFENFKIHTSIYQNSYSDIDFNQVNTPLKKETKDFLLFEFSAKLDPIPTLLCQNHRVRVKGFFGQSTSFNKDKLKDGVTILAESINKSAKYIYGPFGEGAFTFYGGHAPEDKNHYVGDKAQNMALYKNSPGYRLILNNILFPSAKPPEKKT